MTIDPRRARDKGTGMSNKGVINVRGTMGDVQSVVESEGVVQHQGGGAPTAEAALDWTKVLRDLDEALAGEPEGVTDPEACRQLLGLIRDQNVGDAEQRERAGSRLQLMRTMCVDATTVVTLITSALGLLGVAPG
jgi:hypothetical protein